MEDQDPEEVEFNEKAFKASVEMMAKAVNQSGNTLRQTFALPSAAELKSLADLQSASLSKALKDTLRVDYEALASKHIRYMPYLKQEETAYQKVMREMKELEARRIPLDPTDFTKPKLADEIAEGIVKAESMKLSSKEVNAKKVPDEMDTLNQEEIESKRPSIATQVLFLHYLFKQAGFSFEGKKGKEASLIAAITGRHWRNVHDCLNNPIETPSGKTRIKELKAVRIAFEDADLGEIAKLVSKDLG